MLVGNDSLFIMFGKTSNSSFADGFLILNTTSWVISNYYPGLDAAVGSSDGSDTNGGTPGSNSDNGSDGGSGDGLSGGAIAGIVVGVVVGVSIFMHLNLVKLTYDIGWIDWCCCCLLIHSSSSSSFSYSRRANQESATFR